MHVISKALLKQFWEKHPKAKEPLEVWFKLVSGCAASNFSELKRTFGSADYVPGYTIFDVAGNHVRVIAVIHYNRQKLYVRHVFTHADYDAWTKAYRSGKT